VLQGLGSNLMTLGLQAQLTPMIVNTQQQCKVKVEAAAKEFGGM
jgi:hypothetical protein